MIVPPPPPVPAVTAQSPEESGVLMMLDCSATDAASDMTLPHPIVEPVTRVSPASEIIVPRNVVVEPRVAELPTAQVMPPVNGPEPRPITSTLEACRRERAPYLKSPLCVVVARGVENEHSVQQSR